MTPPWVLTAGDSPTKRSGTTAWVFSVTETRAKSMCRREPVRGSRETPCTSTGTSPPSRPVSESRVV